MGNLSHESAWNTNFLGAVGSPDPQDGFSDGKARLPAVSRHDFCHVTAGNWTKLTAVALSRAVLGLLSETLWLVSGWVWTVIRIIGRCILVMMTTVRRGNAAALAGTQCRFVAS
jgi:hypothetical protein